jgi:hypothetical protein
VANQQIAALRAVERDHYALRTAIFNINSQFGFPLVVLPAAQVRLNNEKSFIKNQL